MSAIDAYGSTFNMSMNQYIAQTLKLTKVYQIASNHLNGIKIKHQHITKKNM